MDNITHSLIGIAAAEGIATSRKKHRVPLWISSALANNLPDLDMLLTRFGPHDRLDYLLQHRGHTHTILMAPVQSLVLFLALLLIWRKRPGLPKREIALVVFAGPLLHLFADSWNSYGVHPFWPFDNSWFYGDLIFIIEPWLWASLLPLCWSRSSSVLGKAISLGLLAFLVGLVWYHSFMAIPVAAVITAGILAWLAAQRLIRSDRLRLGLALAICALTFTIFGAARQILKERFSSGVSEVALLAHPGNPFCWTVLTAGYSGTDYVAAAWNASPWPRMIAAAHCPLFAPGEISAGLRPIAGASATPERVPLGEFRRPRAELEEIGRSCYGRAFLRFARIPFWFTVGDQRFLGDLRFDRDRGIGFAEIPLLPEAPECARFDLPWTGRFFPGGS